MAAKEIMFSEKGREQILAGVNILADAVKATLNCGSLASPDEK